MAFPWACCPRRRRGQSGPSWRERQDFRHGEVQRSCLGSSKPHQHQLIGAIARDLLGWKSIQLIENRVLAINQDIKAEVAQRGRWEMRTPQADAIAQALLQRSLNAPAQPQGSPTNASESSN